DERRQRQELMGRDLFIPNCERRCEMVCGEIWGLSLNSSKKSPGANCNNKNDKTETPASRKAACPRRLRKKVMRHSPQLAWRAISAWLLSKLECGHAEDGPAPR